MRASGHPRRAAGSQGAPPAASISELDSQPLDPLPQVMWRQESAAGEFLSVVQGDHTKARFQLLKAGHSILGGRYTLPSYFANQSIYDVFYIHEGVRCGCRSRYSADARLQQSILLRSALLLRQPVHLRRLLHPQGVQCTLFPSMNVMLNDSDWQWQPQKLTDAPPLVSSARSGIGHRV